MVETPRGAYVLRHYQNTADTDRIAYEHALLTRLARLGLSFAVPVPIPTHSGETMVPVSTGAASAPAALFRFIAGRHPDAGSALQAHACAAALGELHQALGRINLRPPAGALPLFGELYRVHPAVPDPPGMLEELPLQGEERAQVMAILHELLAQVPALYASLPRQTVHRDFDGTNVLMEGVRVTGILDFEFARPDLRAIDFAYALYAFTHPVWDTHPEVALVSAFAAGYRERVRLMPAEIEAVPDLMRLYRMVSLIHRAGRHRQGLAHREAVLSRAQALLRLDAWLRGRWPDLRRVIEATVA